MKKTFKYLTVGAATLVLAGCSSRRLANDSRQPTFVPPPPPQGVPPGAIYVPPGGSLPPGARPYYGAPPGPSGPAPYGPPPATNQFPVAPPPPSPPMAPPASSAAPAPTPDRVGYRWEAAPPAAPQPSAPTPPPAPAPQSSQSASPNVLLLPPTPEPGAELKQEPKTEPRKQLYTPEPPTSAAQPVGIAGYEHRVRDNLAAGQRPSLEGLDWLQKQGFKNVVFLHLPADNIDADRQQVEKRGLTFVPIEINPRDLNRDAVERFLRLQTENRADKTFVYDVDGSLCGGMWYLSFRLIDMDTDETARIKSGSLGQGENRDASRELWQAVRKYVEQQR